MDRTVKIFQMRRRKNLFDRKRKEKSSEIETKREEAHTVTLPFFHKKKKTVA